MTRAFTLDRTWEGKVLDYEIETWLRRNISLMETAMVEARPVKLPAGRT